MSTFLTLPSVTRPDPVEPLVYTVAQVARKLQLSERHIENLISEGQLRVVRYGRSKRIHAADLIEFASRGTVR